MARTAQGGLLTVQHRQAQLRVRALALRDFMRIWPLWEGDRDSFERLVTATVPLVTAHHRTSAALAAAYYDTFRRTERVGGVPTPVLAPLETDRVVSSLYVTGSVMTAKAVRAGQSPQAAMQTALVRTGGAVARHVLAGGRDTLVGSSREDSRAEGTLRIVSGGACDFCQSLAGEPTSGDFQAHDHCGCTAEPYFS